MVWGGFAFFFYACCCLVLPEPQRLCCISRFPRFTGCGNMDFSFSPADQVVRPANRIVIFGLGAGGLGIQRRGYSQRQRLPRT